MKKPVTLVTAKSVKLLLCARTRTRERGIIELFTIPFSTVARVVLFIDFTTNDPSF